MDVKLERLEEVFSGAFERPQAERGAYLDRACRGDAELRRRVEALLAYHDNAGNFLKPAESPTIPAVREGPGTVIGRYKLLQQIGEGGMGVVFMAEQEHPVRRRVALKIIKPGMDSRQVVARFEAERQALAVMDHPNIAHVYDAGATDSGRPYFVMELVRGTPITEYCDRHELTTRERLGLLVQVCQAVQHAHTKGIIHRDLKPSNVMVTVADTQATPKVIDFGVAKATQSRLTEKTLFTEFRQLVGTPQYMSPEQAESDGIDIDTRSDVYSLGVLLYELLTGTTPLDGKELRSKAYAEMEKMIRESEPPKPSTRLSTMGDSAKAVAAQRKTDPRRLCQLLHGELDWIVMRALEKDRSRRYETVNGLARDIQRYLADEPVEACPPSATYRARRFLRKHRVPLSIAAGFAIVLSAATIVSSWQAVRATRAEAMMAQQRDRADEEAAIAKAVDEFFSSELLSHANPMALGAGSSSLMGGGKSSPGPDHELKLREALDRAAEAVPRLSAKNLLVEAAVRTTIGNAYAELEEFDRAEPQLKTALEIELGIKGENCEQTLRTVHILGVLYFADFAPRDAKPKAEPMLRRALEGRRKLLGEGHPDTLSSAANLSSVYYYGHQYDKAEAVLLPALARAQNLTTEKEELTGDLKNALACVYLGTNRLAEAEPLLREALNCYRGTYGEHHRSTFVVRQNLAQLHAALGRVVEAEAEMLDILHDNQTLHKDLGPETLSAMSSLCDFYDDQGRFDKAEPLAVQVLEGWRSLGGELHRQTLEALQRLARVYRGEDQYAKAEQLLLQSISGARQVYGDSAPETLSKMSMLGFVYGRTQRFKEDERIAEQVLEGTRNLYGDSDPQTLVAMVQLGASYVNLKEYSTAEPLLRKSSEGLRAARTFAGPAIDAMLDLSTLYFLQGRYEDGERVCREAIETSEKALGREHAETTRTILKMADLYSLQGNPKADELYEDACNRAQAAFSQQHPLTLEAKTGLGMAYLNRHEYTKAEPLLTASTSWLMSGEVRPPWTERWLNAMTWLVIGYLEEGEYAKAEEFCQMWLAAERKLSGEDDDRKLEPLYVLAKGIYMETGRTAEGVQLLRQEYERREKKPGADDLGTLHALSRLGLAYLEAGDDSEAIGAFQELWRRQGAKLHALDGDALQEMKQEMEGTRYLLVMANRAAGRPAEVAKLFEPIRAELEGSVSQNTAALTTRPSDPTLLSERGTSYARLGRLGEAADDFAKAIEVTPDNHHYWHDGLMPLLMELGDEKEFRRRIPRELELFKATSEPVVAHRVAKDALMVQLEGESLRSAIELGNRGLKLGNWAGPQTKGMAEYRGGHFEDAVRWLSLALWAPGPQRTVARLFLAMSYERLGQHAHARAALKHAVRDIDTCPQPGEFDWAAFPDLILCRVVRKEAEALINGGQQPTTKAAPWQNAGPPG